MGRNPSVIQLQTTMAGINVPSSHVQEHFVIMGEETKKLKKSCWDSNLIVKTCFNQQFNGTLFKVS